MYQAGRVKQLLEERSPGLRCDLVPVSTQGDRDKITSLTEIGGQGVFAKELQRALADGEIDCAVHSLKDLPTEIPSGLVLAAVLDRADPRDVLIAPNYASFAQLPPGATLGTSSRRRAAQALDVRPDLQIVELRGNVDTRMAKVVDDSQTPYDAAILAAAGVIRMGWADRITEYLDVSSFTPAPGQAALGVDCRADDDRTLELLNLINDPAVMDCTSVERAFLNGFGGGCRSPVGALACLEGEDLRVWLMTADENLKNVQRRQLLLSAGDAGNVARQTAREMLDHTHA